jgi:hypothetical protein
VPTPISDIDFDRIVPEELLPLAIRRAQVERPDNLPADEAAAFIRKLWRPGRTLRIAFVDDHLAPALRENVHAKVRQYAGQWLEHANLQLVFGCRRMEAEIRIGFDPCLGNWSYIGTDTLAFDDGELTMNLGELAGDPPEERYRHVILHEFGHALGLVHEHQSPHSTIRWNRQAVIKALAGAPNYWNEETIELNVFIRYDTTYSQYTSVLPTGTAFDAASIMVYPIPREWTQDGRSYPANSVLSAADKAFIARCYPR